MQPCKTVVCILVQWNLLIWMPVIGCLHRKSDSLGSLGWPQVVSRSQTAFLAQGVITCSISARSKKAYTISDNALR